MSALYEFYPVSERIEKMNKRYRDVTIRTDAERAMIVTELYRKNPAVVPEILRATTAHEVCEKMTLLVEEDERIVGNRATTFCGNGCYPEWGGHHRWILEAVKDGTWKMGEDGLYHSGPENLLHLTISPDDVEKLESINEFWDAGRTVGATGRAWQPACYEELYNTCTTNYREGGVPIGLLPYGHLVPRFERILNEGYGKIKEFCSNWINEHEGCLMGDDMPKYIFYRAAWLAADAGSVLCRRYSELCREKAETAADGRREELLKMSESLAHIAENPARGYLEACQAVIIYLILVRAEAYIPGLALGRFDQYMWPFLKNDLDSGKLTLEEAQEITDEFFLKSKMNFVPSTSTTAQAVGIGNTWQQTTVGGCDPVTGEDASNPVSYMVLETIARLKLHDPTISLRITPKTPDKLWQLALTTSTIAGGLPLFQNDEAIIKSLMTLDMSLEDARDYSMVGCQEPVGSGCDYPACGGTHPNHSGVHASSVLTMALNDGKNPLNGYQCKMHTGFLYEMNSIEEVREAFRKLFTYIHDMFITIQNYSDFLGAYFCPHPTVSIAMDDCLAKGMDVCRGGARYNENGGAVTGMATIADSLSTIKYMCFDKKLCTTRELYDAYIANWEGYEPLRQQILSEVPHFGNGDPYVDNEFAWCCDMYSEVIAHSHAIRWKHYRSGLISGADHISQGAHAWATPDGRKAFTPIADAASPSQGRDICGPLSVLRSSASYDQTRYPENVCLNMRLHPSVFQGKESMQKVRDMMQTYFNMGGMELQFNVVDTDTLRKAQEDPDEYKDLIVRIAGYSAYFVELDRVSQDDIIARNEHMI